MKNVLKSIAHMFGFEKVDKNVNKALHEFNIRSVLFMSAVIVILEVWLIIRQFKYHIIPEWGSSSPFDLIFYYISQFVLFIVVGIALFMFALTYIYSYKFSEKTRLIMNYIASGIVILYCLLVFKENLTIWDTATNQFKTILLILLYGFSFMSGLLIAIYNTYQYLAKKESQLLSFLVIVFFALLCLDFGVKISFSDHVRVAESQNEIICFLTMIIFVACMIIYRPWISIIINVVIFEAFFYAIKTADAFIDNPITAFKDGDVVNYITFFVSLTTVSVMTYHHRNRSASAEFVLRRNMEYDELTGLKSVYTFQKEIQRFLNITAVDKLSNKIVLFLNVNKFNVFNEQRGFDKGNTFLIELAKIITRTFKGDSVCRDSGDKFVVMTDVTSFKERIEKVRELTRELDKEIKPTIRVGGYILNNPNEDVRRIVDKARYAASSIADRLDIYYAEYDKKMHDDYHFSQYIINNLEEAIEKGYVKPYYQPIVSAKDYGMVSYEALARWIDPKRGYISPARFIPTLEKTKLIHKLDAHIFETVIKDVVEDIELGFKPLPVSINCSRLDFELMNVCELLERLCAKYNLDKGLIHVEVTESALSSEDFKLANELNNLKEHGFRVWLDDFGSGYSSFNILKDYDFEMLKIDMKFLSNFQNDKKSRIILESIIKMAESIGMKTISEGVENDYQKEFLSKAGCERLQGYLFYKPMSKEEIHDLLFRNEIKISEFLE